MVQPVIITANCFTRGDLMSDSVCTNCGAPVQEGAQFCPKCGLQYGATAIPGATATASAPTLTDVPTAPPPPYAPAPPPVGYAPVVPRSGKEKIPAGLLAILLGAFGAHLFYLRHTGWAVGFLLLTIFTCGYGGIITGTIGLIQGIMYLVASDQDFEQKYVVEHRFF